MVDKVKAKVGDKIDRTGECGNCINVFTIMGHGAPGVISVGAGTGSDPKREIGPNLNPQYGDQKIISKLAELKPLFCEDGKAILYGCDVGQGPEGAWLLQTLANLWGVPISGYTGDVSSIHEEWGHEWRTAEPGHEPLEGPIHTGKADQKKKGKKK